MASKKNTVLAGYQSAMKQYYNAMRELAELTDRAWRDTNPEPDAQKIASLAYRAEFMATAARNLRESYIETNPAGAKLLAAATTAYNETRKFQPGDLVVRRGHSDYYAATVLSTVPGDRVEIKAVHGGAIKVVDVHDYNLVVKK